MSYFATIGVTCVMAATVPVCGATASYQAPEHHSENNNHHYVQNDWHKPKHEEKKHEHKHKKHDNHKKSKHHKKTVHKVVVHKSVKVVKVYKKHHKKHISKPIMKRWHKKAVMAKKVYKPVKVVKVVKKVVYVPAKKHEAPKHHDAQKDCPPQQHHVDKSNWTQEDWHKHHQATKHQQYPQVHGDWNDKQHDKEKEDCDKQEEHKPAPAVAYAH
jgi:hypothetical protein